MLKGKITIAFIILFTSLSFAQQADKVIGEYRLPNKLDVEIYKHHEKYFGKIIALNGFEDGMRKDVKNPDKLKRNDPLIGKVIIHNLEFDKDSNEWVNGSMYGPEKGLVFDLKITEVRQNEAEVVGSKYIFKKALVWKKL